MPSMSKLMDTRFWRTACRRTPRAISNNLPRRGECVNHGKQWILHKFWPRSRKAFKKALSFSPATLNAGWSSDGNGPVLKLCKGRIHPFNKVIRKIFGAFGSLTRRLKKGGPRTETTVFRERLFNWQRNGREARTFLDVKPRTMYIINMFFFRPRGDRNLFTHPPKDASPWYGLQF